MHQVHRLHTLPCKPHLPCPGVQGKNVKRKLAKLLDDNPDLPWPLLLLIVARQINDTPSSAIDTMTPHQVVFGALNRSVGATPKEIAAVLAGCGGAR